jgi:hypothetical protein
MLGIMASSITGGLSTTSYASIATVTVGSGGTATVSFTSIPATYTHLQIRAIARTNRANAQGDYLKFNMNSDTAANYSAHELSIYNSITASAANTSVSFEVINRWAGTSQAANTFGGGIIDILDYANTNKYKTTRSLAGWNDNTQGSLHSNSSLWMSTSAITSIAITAGGGTSIDQYSSFALYGIKGA